jgi:hypothetical protein
MTRYKLITIFIAFSMALSAPLFANPDKENSFTNSVTKSGQCGHEKVGEMQYLKNVDTEHGYQVVVLTKATRQGKTKESYKTHDLKAGGKTHLGCSVSDIMPMTSYERSTVSEIQSS